MTFSYFFKSAFGWHCHSIQVKYDVLKWVCWPAQILLQYFPLCSAIFSRCCSLWTCLGM